MNSTHSLMVKRLKLSCPECGKVFRRGFEHSLKNHRRDAHGAHGSARPSLDGATLIILDILAKPAPVWRTI